MRRFFARARAFVRRSRFASELDDEIAAHLEMATAEHVRRGKTAEEARLAAVREFGGVARAREGKSHRSTLGAALWLPMPLRGW